MLLVENCLCESESANADDERVYSGGLLCVCLLFWTLQLWLEAGACPGAAPSGSDSNRRNKDYWKNRWDLWRQISILFSNEYSHMPLGAPGCLVGIGWAVPPPGIIRLDMAWPEGSGRAKMNREFCKFKIYHQFKWPDDDAYWVY